MSDTAELELVEIVPPSLDELTADVGLVSHNVCGNYGISLPNNWRVVTESVATAAPEFMLSNHFCETGSHHFVAKVQVLDEASKDYGALVDHPLLLEDAFFATGPSAHPDEVPEAANPYILITKLKSTSGDAPNVYELVFGSGEALAPIFEEDGFVDGGPYGKETDEELEFLGLQTEMQSEFSSSEKLELRQSLYFHPISDDTLLLMEFGSLGEEADSYLYSVALGTQPEPDLTKYMADPALVGYLTDTLSRI